MADDQVCLYTTVTMEIRQKINTPLKKKVSRTVEHTLKTIIYEEKDWGQLQPPPMSQKNSEGTANAPTQKSATESGTMSALVLVRSRRRLLIRSTVKPFPGIVNMDRIQPRIQNQVSILYSVQNVSFAFKFMSLKETDLVIL